MCFLVNKKIFQLLDVIMRIDRVKHTSYCTLQRVWCIVFCSVTVKLMFNHFHFFRLVNNACQNQ